MTKFLLDENVEDKLRKGLLRRQGDLVIWRIGEPSAPALSTLDPDVLVWCQENDFSLVTNNRTSMPRHLKEHLDSGKHVPGIFILSDDMELSETIEMLLLISGAGKPEEYADRINYLPIRF